jgi:LysM repeat protein
MTRRYVVQAGETLSLISKKFYRDPDLYQQLAAYNGLFNPHSIRANQVLEIPSRRELADRPRRGAGAPPPAELAPPHGLKAIIATFGDIREFIRKDGTLDLRWEKDYLDCARLPFPIPLSWDLSRSVNRIQCHRKLTGILAQVFSAIDAAGCRDKITSFGGCFNFRAKRRGSKLSTHSWGIAIDLNDLTNPPGRAGDLALEVVDAFRRFGFKWGGDWSGRDQDPMHFQFCTGY